jgi:hypothetical protein
MVTASAKDSSSSARSPPAAQKTKPTESAAPPGTKVGLTIVRIAALALLEPGVVDGIRREEHGHAPLVVRIASTDSQFRGVILT